MFGYKTKDLEDEAKKKTDKILKIILEDIERIKSNKEIGVVINRDIARKIDEKYLMHSLRRKNFKVFKECEDGCGSYSLKIIWS